MKRLGVDPTSLRPALLTPPVSKSDAQRALVLAHLSGLWPLPALAGEPPEHLPADVRTMTRGLEVLRQPPGELRDIDCADGGAPFRILLTQAALTPGARVRLHGTERLGERPHRALVDSLREALGPSGLVLREGTPWPVEVHAPTDTLGAPPRFQVSAALSSQYPSSLLLGCAALTLREGRPWAVELEGPLTSAGYLELTVQWLERYGFEVAREPQRLSVRLRARPASAPPLPGDWSSLGYLLLVAWKSGGCVARADPSSPHPDQALLRIVGQVGLAAQQEPDGTMRLVGEPRHGLEASGTECPDLLPTLAALACVLPGPSVLRDVGVLRLKESDRLEGIRELVAAVGGTSELEGETLTLTPPPTPARRFEARSHDDHRLAMTAATLAVLTGARLTLEEPDCVTKSFPGFWPQLERAGVRLAHPERNPAS